MDPRWRIQLFGGLRAERGERVVSRFRSQRTAALLAYLALNHSTSARCPRSHPRSVLIELFWPEWDPELARHNLSVTLSALRAQLEPPGVAAGAVLVADRVSVALSPNAVATDVAEFEAALQAVARAEDAAEQVRLLTAAVDLPRGPLLPGYYEEWVLPEQQRLDELFFQALRRLIDHLARSSDYDRAIEYARRAVRADPLREEAHEELIRLHIAAGQPSAAVRQYRELERLLKQELNTTPGSAIRRLIQGLQEEPLTAGRETGGRLDIGPRLAPDPGGCWPAPAGSRGSPPSRDAETSSPALEPVGGAVPLDSSFYVLRPQDAEFAAAIARRDSIVLVKGPREVGKTSLLARGLQHARAAGMRVALTDLETLNAAHLETAEAFLRALAEEIAEQLDLDVSPEDFWDDQRGPNPNFQRYMRRVVLGSTSAPLVWGLDEVDRLFAYDFGDEIFSLFRFWHNERALDPTGPWSRLTLAMAYATEAHLFVTDLNHSPFNVGTRLTLADFTLDQVAALNCRYGSPLKDEAEVAHYYRLVSGHPYLVRRGLHEMAASGTRLAIFERRASDEDGVFGSHLKRMLALLSRDRDLCEGMQGVLAGRPNLTPRSFYRLRSAGLLAGEFGEEARPRCQLYAAYLRRQLA